MQCIIGPSCNANTGETYFFKYFQKFFLSVDLIRVLMDYAVKQQLDSYAGACQGLPETSVTQVIQSYMYHKTWTTIGPLGIWRFSRG